MEKYLSVKWNLFEIQNRLYSHREKVWMNLLHERVISMFLSGSKSIFLSIRQTKMGEVSNRNCTIAEWLSKDAVSHMNYKQFYIDVCACNERVWFKDFGWIQCSVWIFCEILRNTLLSQFRHPKQSVTPGTQASSCEQVKIW